MKIVCHLFVHFQPQNKVTCNFGPAPCLLFSLGWCDHQCLTLNEMFCLQDGHNRTECISVHAAWCSFATMMHNSKKLHLTRSLPLLWKVPKEVGHREVLGTGKLKRCYWFTQLNLFWNYCITLQAPSWLLTMWYSNWHCWLTIDQDFLYRSRRTFYIRTITYHNLYVLHYAH